MSDETLLKVFYKRVLTEEILLEIIKEIEEKKKWKLEKMSDIADLIESDDDFANLFYQLMYDIVERYTDISYEDVFYNVTKHYLNRVLEFEIVKYDGEVTTIGGKIREALQEAIMSDIDEWISRDWSIHKFKEYATVRLENRIEDDTTSVFSR